MSRKNTSHYKVKLWARQAAPGNVARLRGGSYTRKAHLDCNDVDVWKNSDHPRWTGDDLCEKEASN